MIEALLDLYRAGNLAPRTEEIAERASISTRSLFRYFDDVDALVREAIERQQKLLASLFALTGRPEQPLPGRVASESGRIRAVLRGQLAEVFGPELRQLPAAERGDVLAGLDVASSWEARYLLRKDQRMSSAAPRRVTTRLIMGLLGRPV
ncbi:MAG: TetR family transcriptional regulator [Acidimicrobiia bacterium]|nr:TetR family transcriptional regulator [Acidimicrobiia bacterium]